MNGVLHTCLWAITALLLATASVSVSAGSTYYRWQDDRGNPVHSDRPPPKGIPYEVVTSGSSLIRQVAPEEGAVPAETEPSVSNKFEPTETRKQGVEKNPEQCKTARENLETLNTKVRIQIRDDQGDLRALSEEEIAEQRKRAEDTIQAHCD